MIRSLGAVLQPDIDSAHMYNAFRGKKAGMGLFVSVSLGLPKYVSDEKRGHSAALFSVNSISDR